MQTLEGVKLINEIERKYDVMSIKWKDVSVWPFLRLYIKDSITFNKENKASAANISLVLRCLFAYNPFCVFRKHDIWSFTACDRRKKLGDKMIHRISGALAAQKVNFLMIEKPLKILGHYKKKEIEEKDIISESWLLMTFHILEVLSRIKTPKLENEVLLKHILSVYSIKFDYHRYVRILNAQRQAVKLLMKMTSQPKAVMIECPYDTMGYLWAFHEVGVKIIEMQHGSLNRNHAAYNANAYDPILNPDCICVYGEDEYNYLTKEEPQFAPEVRMTGLYMLERANEFFSKDIFEQDRKKYQSIVVVSGQPVYDDIITSFIDSLAVENDDMLFVYIPRQKEVNLVFKSNNVRVETGVNIYEYLKWADLQITISSTTGLEAQFFHTPTIFYNYNNISSTYFKDVFSKNNGVAFVKDGSQFKEDFRQLTSQNYDYREIFAHDHVKRLMDVIGEFIKNA